MTHEAKIHEAQTSILRELLFVPYSQFSALQKKSGLESDHFKFHIAQLVKAGYVKKSKDGYSLNQLGKEYANKLDTDSNSIERQPKSAVIIVAQDRGKVLVQERLKHPYFGFWGYPGGKIRWGETILEAAARELKEETGLIASMHYEGVYHEHVRSAETNEILEDKIFHVISATNCSGELLEEFDGGRNSWMEKEELEKIDKKYQSTDIETTIGFGGATFVEKTQVYTSEEF